jgi:DNA-binding GntR family transcriptional regulator
MRETLRRLEGEGLVIRSNDGSLMIRLVSLEEFLNSLEVRLLVEPHAAFTAAKSMPDEVLKRLRRGLMAIEPKTMPTAGAHWKFDDQLHETIGLYGGNPLVARIIKDMRRLTKMFEQQKMPERVAPGWAEHEELVKALEAHDQKRAADAMTVHLRQARRSILDTL